MLLGGGTNINIEIDKCENLGDINATDIIVGGMIGCTLDREITIDIKNCTNEGNLNLRITGGGIIGYNNALYVNIENCRNLGNIKAEGQIRWNCW